MCMSMHPIAFLGAAGPGRMAADMGQAAPWITYDHAHQLNTTTLLQAARLSLARLLGRQLRPSPIPPPHQHVPYSILACHHPSLVSCRLPGRLCSSQCFLPTTQVLFDVSPRLPIALQAPEQPGQPPPSLISSHLLLSGLHHLQ